MNRQSKAAGWKQGRQWLPAASDALQATRFLSLLSWFKKDLQVASAGIEVGFEEIVNIHICVVM